ncbi:MAG: DUF4369 domain-containing protein [Bacteroidales bacterium]|nr:DUF4369 domain-containing protein [Bacteroidales bacterium]
MKSKALIAILAITVLTLAGCKGGKGDGLMTFSIDGKLANAAGKTLYIEEMTPDNGAQFVDSIVCDDNGHFAYKGTMAYQTFFNLHTSDYDYIVLLPNDGEKINVSGDANDLGSSYMVDGSPESRLMWQIQNYINDANHTIADLAQQDKQNRATLSEAEYEKAHAVTDSVFIAEHNLLSVMFLNFIDENLGSLSTLYAVDAPFNRSGRIFYAESDFEVFETVLDGLEQSIPNNPHTQYYRTRVERARSARAIAQQQQQPGQEFIVE